MSAPALFAEPVGDLSLFSYYDDATGERVALSAAALGGWAARTAALLRDGCGLTAGDRAAVLSPPHWQTAAVLLGAWSVGVSVSVRAAYLAGLPVLGGGADEPYDASFVARHRLDDWLENVPEARHRFVLNLAPPAGVPLPVAPSAGVASAGVASAVAPSPDCGSDDVAAGYRDFLTEAARYPADAPSYASVGGAAPATVDGTSFDEWAVVARGVADTLDLRPGDRLLVDAGQHEEPVKWLLAPLVAGASVVLCANLDPSLVDARVAAERVTRVL
nr:TIGR03089 family protein [Micromonospora sp. DSM 115978]